MTYEVNKEFMDEVQDELSNYLDDLYDYRTDYTGRSMYGQECVAFVHSESEVRFSMALLMAIRQVAKDNQTLDNAIVTMARREDWWELINLLGSARSDSMGQSTITFFPDLKFVED